MSELRVKNGITLRRDRPIGARFGIMTNGLVKA